MKIAGIDYSNSANSRIQRANLQVPSGSASVPPFQSTFGLDGNCPFFRIFAGFLTTGDDGNAFCSTFTFTNGGTVIGSPLSFVWGFDATYNTSTNGSDPTSGLNIVPFFGDDNIIVHSQYAGICGLIGFASGQNDANGFISRWTALADKLQVSTAPVGTFTQASANYELFHGVLQQPF
jgi:hypothetical protein